MLTNVVLPQWTMGMQGGTIVRWLKHAGDRVNEDEEIVEVETEKVVASVSAPHAGVIAEIRLGEGAVARVLDVLCTLSTEE
jgi:pyruvate/2-oxoglutarate dehydrogenase complex dihydrolipoamide acyltransferase (E2) component